MSMGTSGSETIEHRTASNKHKSAVAISCDIDQNLRILRAILGKHDKEYQAPKVQSQSSAAPVSRSNTSKRARITTSAKAPIIINTLQRVTKPNPIETQPAREEIVPTKKSVQRQIAAKVFNEGLRLLDEAAASCLHFQSHENCSDTRSTLTGDTEATRPDKSFRSNRLVDCTGTALRLLRRLSTYDDDSEAYWKVEKGGLLFIDKLLSLNCNEVAYTEMCFVHDRIYRSPGVNLNTGVIKEVSKKDAALDVRSLLALPDKFSHHPDLSSLALYIQVVCKLLCCYKHDGFINQLVAIADRGEETSLDYLIRVVMDQLQSLKISPPQARSYIEKMSQSVSNVCRAVIENVSSSREMVMSGLNYLSSILQLKVRSLQTFQSSFDIDTEVWIPFDRILRQTWVILKDDPKAKFLDLKQAVLRLQDKLLQCSDTNSRQYCPVRSQFYLQIAEKMGDHGTIADNRGRRLLDLARTHESNSFKTDEEYLAIQVLNSLYAARSSRQKLYENPSETRDNSFVGEYEARANMIVSRAIVSGSLVTLLEQPGRYAELAKLSQHFLEQMIYSMTAGEYFREGATRFLTDKLKFSVQVSNLCCKATRSIQERGHDAAEIWLDIADGLIRVEHALINYLAKQKRTDTTETKDRNTKDEHETLYWNYISSMTELCLSSINDEVDFNGQSKRYLIRVQLSNLFWRAAFPCNTKSAVKAWSEEFVLNLAIKSLHMLESVPIDSLQSAAKGPKLEKLAEMYLRIGRIDAAKQTLQIAFDHYILAGALSDAVEASLSSISGIVWTDASFLTSQLARVITNHSKISSNAQLATSDNAVDDPIIFDDPNQPSFHRAVLLEMQISKLLRGCVMNVPEEFYTTTTTVLELAGDVQYQVWCLRFVVCSNQILLRHECTLLSFAMPLDLSNETFPLFSYARSLKAIYMLQHALKDDVQSDQLAIHVEELTVIVAECKSAEAFAEIIDDPHIVLAILQVIINRTSITLHEEMTIKCLSSILHIYAVLDLAGTREWFVSCLQLVRIQLARDDTVTAEMNLKLAEQYLVLTGVSPRDKVYFFLALLELQCRQLDQQAFYSTMNTIQKLCHEDTVDQTLQTAAFKLEHDAILARTLLLTSRLNFRTGDLKSGTICARHACKLTTSIWTALERKKKVKDTRVEGTTSLTSALSGLKLIQTVQRTQDNHQSFLDLHKEVLNIFAHCMMHHGLYSDSILYHKQLKDLLKQPDSATTSLIPNLSCLKDLNYDKSDFLQGSDPDNQWKSTARLYSQVCQLIERASNVLEENSMASVLRESVLSLPNSSFGGSRTGKSCASALQSVGSDCRILESQNVWEPLRDFQEQLSTAMKLIDILLSGKEPECSTEMLHTMVYLQARVNLLLTAMNNSCGLSSTELVLQSSCAKDCALERERICSHAEAATKTREQLQSWPIIKKAPFKSCHTPVHLEAEQISLLPSSWSVISISLANDSTEIVVSKCLNDKLPVVVRVPLCRSNEAELTEDFGVELALSELADIIEQANTSCHDRHASGDRAARMTWHKMREDLDARLESFLLKVENVWLGGFCGMLSPAHINYSAFESFNQSFITCLNKHLPSRHKTGNRKSGPDIHKHIIEMFLGLTHKNQGDLDDALMDLLYFIIDILQFDGEPNAHDEIDYDALLADVIEAMEIYQSASKSVTESRHTILIIDKELEAIPWESLPCLINHSVSRMPSLGSVFSRVEQIRQLRPDADTFMLPFMHSGHLILNPSKDLNSTQTLFEPILTQPNCTTAEYGSQIAESPSEAQFCQVLTGSDVVLYLGHGSGVQYIRPRLIRSLPRVPAVTFLMGCSSLKMTTYGPFESTGLPRAYMLAGREYNEERDDFARTSENERTEAMAVVGTLWDVTDREIDRCTLKTLADLGLIDGSDKKVVEGLKKKGSRTKARQKVLEDATGSRNLMKAVVKGRKECTLRYLSGAAVVVYGVPVGLARIQ